jgi:transposase
VRVVAVGTASRIRIDAVRLAVEPLDMRAGTDTVLARIVNVFGEARAHHVYLFANRRANRLKALVHDGIGIWRCARRLHQGGFTWSSVEAGTTGPRRRGRTRPDPLHGGIRRTGGNRVMR